jgi:hypothetical protein
VLASKDHININSSSSADIHPTDQRYCVQYDSEECRAICIRGRKAEKKGNLNTRIFLILDSANKEQDFSKKKL